MECLLALVAVAVVAVVAASWHAWAGHDVCRAKPSRGAFVGMQIVDEHAHELRDVDQGEKVSELLCPAEP